MVDAVMRTLRNALGPFSDGKLWNNDLMQQLVAYYNNTYHVSIKQTPAEFIIKKYVSSSLGRIPTFFPRFEIIGKIPIFSAPIANVKK